MTQSEYARRIKVNRSTVNRLVKKGVIPVDEHGDIDPVVADRAYQAALHPGYDHCRRAQLPLDGPPPAPNDSPGAASAPDNGVGVDTLDDVGGETLNGRTLYREYATEEKKCKAILARLDVEERQGLLVDAKKVEVEAFQVFRDVRDSLLNIPNRVAGALAAELGLEAGTGQEKVFAILNHEITDALEAISHATRQS